MLIKNNNLPLIPRNDGRLPVHMAVSAGRHRAVENLSSASLLERMAPKDIQLLFFMTINKSIYDVATKLFEKYPAMLTIAKDDQDQVTALHMLVRKRPQELGVQGLRLLREMWSHVQEMEYNNVLPLISEPSPILFDATRAGNIDAVVWLLDKNPELVAQKDSRGYNLLQFAASHRQLRIVDCILTLGTANLVIQAMDDDCNNILHVAAHMPEESSNLSPVNLLGEELSWIKKMEKRFPPKLRTMRNNKGQTPDDAFYLEHKELCEKAKAEATSLAKFNMVVATLIAAILFAALITSIPGDHAKGYFGFFWGCVAGLFTASASIIWLLTLSISNWCTRKGIIISLFRLNAGIGLLWISAGFMCGTSFGAACLIIDIRKMSQSAEIVASALIFLPALAMVQFVFPQIALLAARLFLWI